MENTHTQLAYLDPAFNFVRVNSAYVAGTGRTRADLLGRNHFALFPDEENERIFERVRQTGQPADYRAKPFVYRNQPERPLTFWDWTLVPVRNSAGRTQGLVFSLTDVTEQKRAEEILRNARDELERAVRERTAALTTAVAALDAEVTERRRVDAQLRVVLDQLPAVLWTTNRESVITSIEGAGLATLGLLQSDIMGRPVGHPADEAKSTIRDAHERALQGESCTYQTVMRGVYLEAYVEPLRDAEGQITGTIGVSLDITERRAAEKALREREHQYRSIFESTTDALLIIALDGRIIDANPAASSLTGYSHHELRAMSPGDFIAPSQRSQFARFVSLARQVERVETQTTGQRKDGGTFDVEIRATRFLYGGESHILSIVRDVSERVRSIQLLETRVRERTSELAAMLDISRAISATLEQRPLMALVVGQLERLIPGSRVAFFASHGDYLELTECRGFTAPSRVEETLIDLGAEMLDAVMPGGFGPSEPGVVISDLTSAELTGFAVRWRSRMLQLVPSARAALWAPLMVKGQLVGGLGIVDNEVGRFTPREAELAQSIANQAAIALENARLYEQAQELAILQERQRLARELHDSVTQSLYSLVLMTEATRRLMALNQMERLTLSLGRIADTAQQVLKEMRLLVYELRPTVLARDGLASALRQRLQAVESRAGVDAQLIVEGSPLMPEPIEGELYRVAQEALNNSLKHSGASSVIVRLEVGTTTAAISVTDNGRGFDTTVNAPGGFGFTTMKERAQRLGGNLLMTSQPGQGATIRLEIPLPAFEDIYEVKDA